MKNYIILLLFTIIAVTSCTSGFEDDNSDNTRRGKGEIASEAFLQPLIYDGNRYLVQRSFQLTGEIMQYTVIASSLNIYHRYDIKESEPDVLWRNLYRWASNARDMSETAHLERNYGIEGMGMIMEVLMMSNLTDIFGSIPYKESFRTDEYLLKPRFDPQPEVYDSIFAKLERANTILNGATTSTTKDLLYAGDCTKWRKFGNSLYLRLLMRLSKRNGEVDVAGKIAEIVNNPTQYPIFTSSADAARLGFSGVYPDINYYNTTTNANFERSRRISVFMVDQLNNTFDPRISKMFTRGYSNEFYTGVPSGELESTVQQYQYNAAYINTSLKANTAKFAMMNYSELQFILAEACLRGYLPVANAENYYKKGVEASLLEWGCTQSEVSLFLNGANVAFPSSVTVQEKLERVMMQKYISLFFVGFESWSDYRRTGLPVLPKGSALMNDGILPTRLTYPTSEQSTNRTNWQQAVKEQGEDNMKTTIWWAK